MAAATTMLGRARGNPHETTAETRRSRWLGSRIRRASPSSTSSPTTERIEMRATTASPSRDRRVRRHDVVDHAGTDAPQDPADGSERRGGVPVEVAGSRTKMLARSRSGRSSGEITTLTSHCGWNDRSSPPPPLTGTTTTERCSRVPGSLTPSRSGSVDSMASATRTRVQRAGGRWPPPSRTQVRDDHPDEVQPEPADLLEEVDLRALPRRRRHAPHDRRPAAWLRPRRPASPRATARGRRPGSRTRRAQGADGVARVPPPATNTVDSHAQ